MGRLIKRLIYYRKINALKHARLNYHTISDMMTWLDEYITLYHHLGRDLFRLDNAQDKAINTNYKNIAELFDNINMAKVYLDNRVGKLSLTLGDESMFTFSRFKTNDYNNNIHDVVVQEYLQTLVIPYIQKVIDTYKSGYTTIIGKQKILLLNVITLLKVVL